LLIVRYKCWDAKYNFVAVTPSIYPRLHARVLKDQI
jgi:hypothetical protein